MEKNKIFNMDCIEGMKQLPDESVDAIITDVPYNLGDTDSTKIKFKDRADMNRATGDDWNKGFYPIAFLPEAKRVLKKNGNIFIYTHHRHFGDYYKWLDSNFDRVFFGVWHKTNPVPQIRKVSFLSACELFICAWNKGHKWNFKTQNEMHNFIQLPICMGKERTSHSAQKPLKTMTHLIEVSTDEGDIVLDPFMGSGTTAEAALKTGRSFVGFEIDKGYFEESQKRLSPILEQSKLTLLTGVKNG